MFQPNRPYFLGPTLQFLLSFWKKKNNNKKPKQNKKQQQKKTKQNKKQKQKKKKKKKKKEIYAPTESYCIKTFLTLFNKNCQNI